MTDKKSAKVSGAPIWGIFLLFLGVVFLLQTLNVLPWGLWETMWRFWPVLLIIAGLGILLRRFNVWLVSLLVLAILAACLGIAIRQQGTPLSAATVTKSYSQPLGNMERAEIELDFAAGSLAISPLTTGSTELVKVDSATLSGGREIKADFRQESRVGKLYLNTVQASRRWGDGSTKWQVNLTRNIPLTLRVTAAATTTELDLSQLKVGEFRFDLNAGNAKVTLPSASGSSRAFIEANAANVEVTIPSGVAAKVRVSGSLNSLDILESRFPKNGDYYISPDFDTASNRLVLEIDGNVSRVKVQ